jgi:hypothetical protein
MRFLDFFDDSAKAQWIVRHLRPFHYTKFLQTCKFMRSCESQEYWKRYAVFMIFRKSLALHVEENSIRPSEDNFQHDVHNSYILLRNTKRGFSDAMDFWLNFGRTLVGTVWIPSVADHPRMYPDLLERMKGSVEPNSDAYNLIFTCLHYRLFVAERLEKWGYSILPSGPICMENMKTLCRHELVHFNANNPQVFDLDLRYHIPLIQEPMRQLLSQFEDLALPHHIKNSMLTELTKFLFEEHCIQEILACDGLRASDFGKFYPQIPEWLLLYHPITYRGRYYTAKMKKWAIRLSYDVFLNNLKKRFLYKFSDRASIHMFLRVFKNWFCAHSSAINCAQLNRGLSGPVFGIMALVFNMVS